MTPTKTWQAEVYGHTKSGYRMVTGSVTRRIYERLGNIEERDLSDRERDMIELRFGLQGPPATLQAIADNYGLTRERVRQIINRALDRLDIDPWE